MLEIPDRPPRRARAIESHLAFVTDRRMLFNAPGPTPRCVVCLQDDVEMGCERCGSPIHGDCHFRKAASAGEQAIFQAAVVEMDVRRLLEIDGHEQLLWAPPGPAEQAVAQLLLLCPAFRS
jgi:hypothetical protein